MKKRVLAILMFASCVCFFSSCNKAEDDLVQVETTQVTTPGEYHDFMHSLDSLNALYLSNASMTRGNSLVQYGAGHITEKLADSAGNIVGGQIGKNIGCALGSLFGNPVTAIGGYVVGRYVGRVAGSFLCSYAANVITNAFFRSRAFAGDTLNDDYYIPENYIDVNDSVGYYHNLAMTELYENRNKYFLSNGDLNYDLIYDDLVVVLRANGFADQGMLDDAELKASVISYTKVNVKYIKEYNSGTLSTDEYHSKLVEDMKQRGLPEESVVAFSDFAKEVVETTSLLSNDDKKDYADDVNAMIQKSALDDSLKEEMRATTNMIVNSSICYEN